MSDINFEPVFGGDIAADVLPDAAQDSAPKKKKRGRPSKYASDEERKAARRERDRAKRAEKEAGSEAGEGTFAEDLKALREAYAKEAPASALDPEPEGATPESAAPRPIMTGYLLLVAIDALAPVAVRLLFRRDASTLSLTDKERERLGPLADAAAEDLTKHLTPAQMFIGALVGVYAAKIPTLPKLPPKTKRR